jgi:hypothetical protein
MAKFHLREIAVTFRLTVSQRAHYKVAGLETTRDQYRNVTIKIQGWRVS